MFDMTKREKQVIINSINKYNKEVEKAYDLYGIESDNHKYWLAKWAALVDIAKELGI